MSDLPPSPLLRRLSPGAWTALAWAAGLLYAGLASSRLPGEAHFPRGRPFLDLGAVNTIFLIAAVVVSLAGCVLLRRFALSALTLLLTGAVWSAIALISTEIEFPQFLAAEVALCHIAATRSRRSSIVAGVLVLSTLIGFSAVRVLLGFPIGTSAGLAVLLTAVIAWLIGNSARQSSEHARILHAQAVTAERLRIARELHDMVAHSMGIIAIQSGAAAMVIDTQPAKAREALIAVETASRDTLAGLRRMLGALRRAEPAPLPGLAEVEHLVETTAAAGVRVDLRWQGPRDDLPADLALSAYRIVQESLTNVVRHAETDRCTVAITHQNGELAIEVLDSGRGGSAHPGYGIVGMRERATLLHGRLTAGPRPEGGFRVSAHLPVPTR